MSGVTGYQVLITLGSRRIPRIWHERSHSLPRSERDVYLERDIAVAPSGEPFFAMSIRVLTVDDHLAALADQLSENGLTAHPATAKTVTVA
jgi:hypothetical protein